ncbi:MAG: LytTR family transcriptional regulator [Sphingomonadaceae bacterium]|nr:LytTR family transcriptional regulator [Sphingomonadaceae bacterium]
MFLLASAVGFMGPFGTYLNEGLVERIIHWWQLLMGAYLLIRPTILFLLHLARSTELPARPVVFWGVVISSAPLAFIWRSVGQDEFRELDGYAGLLPFSLLCSLAVMGVSQWAQTADLRLRGRQVATSRPADPPPTDDQVDHAAPVQEPALRSRLSDSFTGPILALQSEDHYVRVHGETASELILIRLRDAIAEMDGVEGVQVHRSWWIARDAVASAEPSGRSWAITLRNGEVAPVARDSIDRLRATGLLDA